MKHSFFLFILTSLVTSCTNHPTVTYQEKSKALILANQMAGEMMQDRQWTVQQYVKASGLLKGLKAGNEADLSGFLREETGQALVERLTDIDNYKNLLSSPSLDTNFNTGIQLFNALGQLNHIFYTLNKTDGHLIYGHEMILSAISNLHMFRLLNGLIDQKFPDKVTLDPTRKQGLQQMQTGLYGMLTGAIMTIRDDYKLYEKKDILKLASYLSANVATMQQFLNPPDQQKTEEEIKKIKNSNTYPEVKAAFAE